MTKHYPGDTATFSKGRSQLPANAPLTIRGGVGAWVFSDDGRSFLDWTLGLAAVSLGYGHRAVVDAVTNRVAQGAVFGLPHRLEFEYADALCDVLPWGDDSAVKYGKNGSDATEGAIRAARAITGRDQIVSIGYHGWLSTCPNKNGIPRAVQELVLEYLDWDAATDGVAERWPNVAAVIVEPDAITDKSMTGIVATCRDHGALLIFDEILTGFRTPGYWWAKYKGVTPDFITAGKAIANGYPLSVIAGRADLMEVFDGGIGYSFTYAGDTMGLAAGMATLRTYQREPVIDRLYSIGRTIQQTWRDCETEFDYFSMPLVGEPSRLVVKYPSLAHRTLFSQEMVRRGILWTVGATPCFMHTATDVERTRDAIRESFKVLVSVADDPARLVDGPIVSMPYRQMVTA